MPGFVLLEGAERLALLESFVRGEKALNVTVLGLSQFRRSFISDPSDSEELDDEDEAYRDEPAYSTLLGISGVDLGHILPVHRFTMYFILTEASTALPTILRYKNNNADKLV